MFTTSIGRQNSNGSFPEHFFHYYCNHSASTSNFAKNCYLWILSLRFPSVLSPNLCFSVTAQQATPLFTSFSPEKTLPILLLLLIVAFSQLWRALTGLWCCTTWAKLPSFQTPPTNHHTCLKPSYPWPSQFPTLHSMQSPTAAKYTTLNLPQAELCSDHHPGTQS